MRQHVVEHGLAPQRDGIDAAMGECVLRIFAHRHHRRAGVKLPHTRVHSLKNVFVAEIAHAEVAQHAHHAAGALRARIDGVPGNSPGQRRVQHVFQHVALLNADQRFRLRFPAKRFHARVERRHVVVEGMHAVVMVQRGDLPDGNDGRAVLESQGDKPVKLHELAARVLARLAEQHHRPARAQGVRERRALHAHVLVALPAFAGMPDGARRLFFRATRAQLIDERAAIGRLVLQHQHAGRKRDGVRKRRAGIGAVGQGRHFDGLGLGKAGKGRLGLGAEGQCEIDRAGSAVERARSTGLRRRQARDAEGRLGRHAVGDAGNRHAVGHQQAVELLHGEEPLQLRCVKRPLAVKQIRVQTRRERHDRVAARLQRLLDAPGKRTEPLSGIGEERDPVIPSRPTHATYPSLSCKTSTCKANTPSTPSKRAKPWPAG